MARDRSKTRGETRNRKREITRIAAGLTKAGLTVSHTEFDPVTGHVIYHTTTANGEKCRVTDDSWEKFIRDEKAKKQDRPCTRLPPFTQAFVDRYGTPRFYLRKKGIKPVALPGLPWSPEFMAAREAALSGQWELPKAGTLKAGTVDAAVVGYMASDAFTKALSPGTRAQRRHILEKLRREHGARRADMPSEAVALILDGKTPAAQ